MSTTYSPTIIAVPRFIPAMDGVQSTPPVWWHAMAADINAESGSAFDNARYNEATGEIESLGTPYLQDTYETGTASRSGTAFTVVTGAWQSDAVSPWSDKYMLLQPDSTEADWSVLQTTANANGLQNNLVVIRLGVAPAGVSAAHASSGCYTYLRLAYGSTVDYRIAFPWGEPIRLEYTTDGGTTWRGVAYARKLGSVENYLAHHGNEIRLHIRPDARRGIMAVEVGDGNWLRHSVARPGVDGTLGGVGTFPTLERYAFLGAYRWASLEVYPLQFGTLTLTKGPRYFTQDRLANANAATAYGNFAGDNNAEQISALSLVPDGYGSLGYEVQSANADASLPATFSDILIHIPSTWRYDYFGTPLPEPVMSATKYRELQVWDDATRMGMTSGRLTVNNKDFLYDGAYGNYAINLICGNGQTFGQRVRGVLGCDPQGISISRHDPYRFAEFPVRDFWAKLEVPIGQEVVLDGISIFEAVRQLLDIGQVNPNAYAYNVPADGFPPAGGYPDNFPHYILGKGTGLSPKYRFPPDMLVLHALQTLIQDSGDPYSLAPHYMWFDSDGQFHYEPYNPASFPPVQFYFTYDATGQGQMFGLTQYNSIAQLRTEVILQGQDAYTYELLQYNIPLPGNVGAVGYQFRWLERNARYATPAYMNLIGQIAARQASLPTQIIRFSAPFWPHVFAGAVIGVPEVGAGLFQVLEIDTVLGHDEVYHGPENTHCYSTITARSLVNAIP